MLITIMDITIKDHAKFVHLGTKLEVLLKSSIIGIHTLKNTSIINGYQ